MTINTRMEIDEYFIKMARLVSLRGACVRRQVGCVLVSDLNHVLATGYNGRARGVTNCLETPCRGNDLVSGLGLEKCEAIHAESNALLQCKDVEKIRVAYCTTAPCVHCVKLLMNTGCTRIVFEDAYPHMEESRRLWESAPWPVSWEQFPTQYHIFSDMNQPDHEHEWQEMSIDTGHEDTVYVVCECGLRKEVCK